MSTTATARPKTTSPPGPGATRGRAHVERERSSEQRPREESRQGHPLRVMGRRAVLPWPATAPRSARQGPRRGGHGAGGLSARRCAAPRERERRRRRDGERDDLGLLAQHVRIAPQPLEGAALPRPRAPAGTRCAEPGSGARPRGPPGSIPPTHERPRQGSAAPPTSAGRAARQCTRPGPRPTRTPGGEDQRHRPRLVARQSPPRGASTAAAARPRRGPVRRLRRPAPPAPASVQRRRGQLGHRRHAEPRAPREHRRHHAPSGRRRARTRRAIAPPGKRGEPPRTPSTAAVIRAVSRLRPATFITAPVIQNGNGSQLVPLASQRGARAQRSAISTRAKSSSLTCPEAPEQHRGRGRHP